MGRLGSKLNEYQVKASQQSGDLFLDSSSPKDGHVHSLSRHANRNSRHGNLNLALAYISTTIAVHIGFCRYFRPSPVRKRERSQPLVPDLFEQ